MPFLLIIWNNKRWSMIVLLCIVIFCQLAYTNHLAGNLRNAETDCEARVAKAIKPFNDAEEAAQKKADEASEQYEDSKEVERVKTETITREVQKIVERPVYLNNCFDDAGVSAVNAAGNTG